MKTIPAIFLLSLCLFFSANVHARHAAILLDAETGKILHETEAHQAWYPASLTKLMTLYMAFSALNAGQIQLQDNVTASHHAAVQPISKLHLRVGETITVENAILALITRSANDAAVALAEHIGGTEENFAVKMTARAHSLGMADSYFVNATGLPSNWQVSTPRDLGLLAWRTLHDFPDYYPYFSARSMTFRGQELHAINKFTNTYPGAEGMKTGFTCGSGYNLISTANQNGKRLIGVVMGGMSSAERYQLMISMMDDGFSNRYSGYKHITMPPTLAAGTPPYQLECGNRSFATHTASYDDSSDDDNRSTAKPVTKYTPTKYVRNGSKFSALPAATFAAAPASHKIAKSKPIKTVSSRKVVSKTAKAADRSRYKRIVVAAVSSSKKRR